MTRKSEIKRIRRAIYDLEANNFLPDTQKGEKTAFHQEHIGLNDVSKTSEHTFSFDNDLCFG